MNYVVYLSSAAAGFSDGYGADAAPSTGGALAGLTVYLVLFIAGWVLTLFIAFWIIRAGVRGGVQQLVEQNRQTVALMQSQSSMLSQLVKAQAPGTSGTAPGSPTDDAGAWDKLRGR